MALALTGGSRVMYRMIHQPHLRCVYRELQLSFISLLSLSLTYVGNILVRRYRPLTAGVVISEKRKAKSGRAQQGKCEKKIPGIAGKVVIEKREKGTAG